MTTAPISHSRAWVKGAGGKLFYLLRLHHAVVVKVLVDEDPRRLRSLVLGAQAGDLAPIGRPGGLSHGVDRHQVDYRGDQHQQRQDGADDQHRQVELPAFRQALVGHDDNEDHQAEDEGEGRHGDHEALPRPRVVVVAPQTAVAVVVSGAVRAAAAKAPVTPSITSPVTSSIIPPVAESSQGSLTVPRQCGGHAGKYGHRHDNDEDGHDFEDAWWRRPLVEVLELVIWVVGICWLSRAVTVDRININKYANMT